METIREMTAEGWRVRLDLHGQVLHLDVPRYNFVIWSEDALSPTVPRSFSGFVSAAALLWKAKQFDDGLVAAVERAVQHGSGRFVGKACLLRSLVRSLLDSTSAVNSTAAALLFGAGELGGLALTPPPDVQQATQELVERFLADERSSKPLGFYTWSDELRAVFRQDRLLQTELPREPAVALAYLLQKDREAFATYETYLRLMARLTNPLDGRDLLRPQRQDEPASAEERWSFFPPSRSHEAALVEKLFGDRPIPEGFNLMDELIRRVRAGEVRLGPVDSSGWNDYQTWALEPLIQAEAAPEADRLRLSAPYRLHLEQLFRGLLALTRETHVKQLRAAVGGCAFRRTVIHVYPELNVEPLPEVYRRRAIGYRFVRDVLEAAFGTEALGSLHRLTPDGPVEADLAAELAWVEGLFQGAYAVACRELGMPVPRRRKERSPCFGIGRRAWRETLTSGGTAG